MLFVYVYVYGYENRKSESRKKLQRTASKSVFGGLILDGAEGAYFLGARVTGHSGSAPGLFVRGKDEAVE